MAIEREGNKIIFSRVFDARIQDVFNAYTTKTKFEQWFHPKGASTEVYDFDARPGDKNFFKINAPDGQSYTVMQYDEIEAPYKIIYHDYFANEKGQINPNMNGMKVEIYFESKGDEKTEVKSISIMPTEQSAQQLLDMGVEEGMESTLDQLEELLKK
ncbi:SRPBCC family protein [Staphylococcus carnosus]|uniref:SRPBCC family protein n=1 Tax=Staphylococcus carnosus TaxID=1281 RepID=UPI000CCFE245|nr:SRPBCC domain-containing protein [Staphylococcus carnosus]PNZ98143.1 glutathione S-transferase [Staphylococcus carnosus]QRQ04431.1 SRPBCC domain-containing protein [Staphylococcus carnosus]UTB83570.1 glutathione S-transferase [Staphylococcus carnosus]SUM05274.1 glutathione S-transferase [Staphylococcus carnosus]GEP79425.1 glutathione S-transferase [Staphylococcus carnosus]